MGKVKERWQEERDRRYLELTTKYSLEGMTDEEAHDQAVEDMEEEDAANGQFGVGA
jgi:hypothetical protein